MKQQRPVLIVLNGASSSIKTSTAFALKELFGANCVSTGLDDVLRRVKLFGSDKDGAPIERYDTEASSAYISGDGRYVFLSGWKNDAYGTPWTEVYDMLSNRFVKRIDNVSLMPTYRMDGKIVLVSSDTISNNVYYMAFIESDTWSIASDWKGPDYVNWLIAP